MHFRNNLFLQIAERENARAMYIVYVFMDIFAAIYFREFLLLAKVAKIKSPQKRIDLQYIAIDP